MRQPEPMADLRATFFDECDELMEAFQDGLDDLGRGGGTHETVHALFRSVHSIKSGAATFGFDGLTKYAHNLENTLTRLRNDKSLPSLAEISDLLRASDHLAALVTAARQGSDVCDAHDTQSAAPENARKLDIRRGADEQSDAASVHLKPATDLWKQGLSCREVLSDLGAIGQCEVRLDDDAIPTIETYDPEQMMLTWQIDVTCHTSPIEEWIGKQHAALGLAMNTADQVVPPEVKQPERNSATTAAPTPKATIRVELERVDRMINLVGELVINQAMLAQTMEGTDLTGNLAYGSGLDDFLRLTRDLQDSVMQIRAQPVKPLFMRMARICRETAHTVEKPVDLIMEGADTEIDKTVIERLTEPLTHMIRNAVDHGIEPPDQRKAAGKAANGTIKLRALHRSGQVIVELSDDGAGIDRASVQRKAETQGIIGPNARLSDAEIDALLFHPGLSTAKTVSDVSGRGVGMDVVRSAIHALGGRLMVESRPGQGTRFSIALPLTLAVLDSMIIGAQGHTLVLPLSAIRETLHVRPSQVVELPTSSGGSRRLLRYNDRVIPICDLADELGFSPRRSDLDGALALIVTHEDTATSAIIIDEILEQRQVVIKGLQDGFATHPCIAAATILGDGRIALIVDPYELTPATAQGSTQAAVPLAQTG
ncbi:chemotaxis protein CheA [Shimia ponticola]|uniref:chemotaxis protein CheA n=1 Tax=Shimia ponticola TaxID=2582893 RepID=UPI0011BE2DB7|nr:chemotaxis protein CheA [Shimia ponticola]